MPDSPLQAQVKCEENTNHNHVQEERFFLFCLTLDDGRAGFHFRIPEEWIGNTIVALLDCEKNMQFILSWDYLDSCPCKPFPK